VAKVNEQYDGGADDRMSDIESLASGKGVGDENFPVASALIAPRHRPVVLAFYRVARMGDDVADHPALSSSEKIDRLTAIETSLTTSDDVVPAAAALRQMLVARKITDRHMLDLLEAFRRDAVKTRYTDWGDLMDYCRYSAAPVGRFMLDVHGESEATWPASDALCAALQVINHLQDCGKDYLELDRVYLPQDALAAAGLDVRALGEAKGSLAFRGVIAGLALRTAALLSAARPLHPAVRDLRLALEIGVIQTLAEDLNGKLLRRDPLSEKVHHSRIGALGIALTGAVGALAGRLSPRSQRPAGA
jgi:squalene synthase HpnC